MLTNLPSEIIHSIILKIHKLSDYLHLCLTCRTLNEILSDPFIRKLVNRKFRTTVRHFVDENKNITLHNILPNGRKDGKEIIFNDITNEIRHICKWKNGRKHGYFMTLTQNGKILTLQIWSNGTLSSNENWWIRDNYEWHVKYFHDKQKEWDYLIEWKDDKGTGRSYYSYKDKIRLTIDWENDQIKSLAHL